MEKNRDFKWSRFLLDIAVDIALVVLMVFFIRGFLFAPFRVHGPSMCDSFNYYNDECYNGDGEFILVSRLGTWDIGDWSPGSLERGDVIVFQAPYSEPGEFYIKRVIGLPGDTVKIADGNVYLKDSTGTFQLLEEPYLNEENSGHTYSYRTDSEVYSVPDDEYFTLGDNRTKSSDARRCFQQLGCSDGSSPYLKKELIQGEVKVVLFPFSHFRFVRAVKY